MARRRVHSESSDEDEDEGVETRTGTPRSVGLGDRKRMRLSAASARESSSSGSDEGGHSFSPAANSISHVQRRQRSHGPSDFLRNGNRSTSVPHKPGAIVRVRLTNFVTYTSAEFFPGPNLNMVIGPNGTGKSTLVCALCLGLGWGPVHLGRAKELREFVKHGCDEATIEIELQGDPARRELRRNPIIRRMIKKDNKNSFEVNGKSIGVKKVQELARSFSIQIDNLCQFLPQDKVVEFAAMTPIELLQSTLRAAEGPEMLEWHQNLKDLRSEQKQLLSQNNGERETLANLEKRQEVAKVEYDKFIQLKEIERKISWMEKSRPITHYAAAQRRFNEAREARKQIERELETLEEKTAPALQKVQAKQDYVRRVVAYSKKSKSDFENGLKNTDQVKRGIDHIAEEILDIESHMAAEATSQKAYREDSKRIRLKVANIEKAMEQEVDKFDPATINEELRELTRQKREIEQAMTESVVRSRQTQNDARTKKQQYENARTELEGLESQSGQQESKLQRVSHDSDIAWKWVQKNQSKFQNQVFGPAIVECSLKDPKYADAVESLLQQTEFTAFTVQSREDFKTLQYYLTHELKLHDISIKTVTMSIGQFRTSFPENLRRWGFEGWAIDCVNGPDPVLAMLCMTKMLHQTPIALRDVSETSFSEIEKSSLGSFVAGKTSYRVVRRREYGDGAVSTNTRSLRPARFWTTQSVDMHKKRELEELIHDRREELKQMQTDLHEQRAHREGQEQQLKEVDQEKEDLTREKDEKQRALAQFNALPSKLEEAKGKYESIQESLREIQTRHAELSTGRENAFFRKADAALQVAQAVSHIRELYTLTIKAEVLVIEAISDHETLAEQNQDLETMLQNKRDALKIAIEEAQRYKQEATSIVTHVKAYLAEADKDPEMKAWIDEHIDRNLPPEELEAMIESEKASREIIHVGNRNIVQEYTNRQKNIEKLTAALQSFREKQDDLKHAINEIRGLFEPRLDSLVEKISAAFSDSFSRIGCAGQVEVYKASSMETLDVEQPSDNDDPSQRRTQSQRHRTNPPFDDPNSSTGNGLDFSSWALHISVKFRESDNLSLLDSHRQSGGERAVSTIFYLMALQSLSRAPFRVVDEINQGMDPRNERMVHGRLVEMACSGDGQGAGQYFLITPKLLDHLIYRPGMRVLCIVSGEKMPGPKELKEMQLSMGGRIDFGVWIDRKRALDAAQGAAGRRVDSGVSMGSSFEGSRVEVGA